MIQTFIKNILTCKRNIFLYCLTLPRWIKNAPIWLTVFKWFIANFDTVELISIVLFNDIKTFNIDRATWSRLVTFHGPSRSSAEEKTQGRWCQVTTLQSQASSYLWWDKASVRSPTVWYRNTSLTHRWACTLLQRFSSLK